MMIPDVNLIDHPFEGAVWTVKGSKGKTYDVTLSRNGLWCTCTRFNWYSTCKHEKEVYSKLSGEVMENPYVCSK